MRPDPVIEFFLGLAAIVVALGVALLFAFPPSWLDSRKNAVAIFTNTGGVSEGADVSWNGRSEGNVVAVKGEGGHFRVFMKLNPDWTMPDGGALTIVQPNPLQAAGLAVAKLCKAPTTAEKPAEGCCPDHPVTPSAGPNEIALASCGKSPNLIDEAVAISVKVNGAINGLNEQMPVLTKKTFGALDATTSGLTKMVAVEGVALDALNPQNRENLKSALASAKTGTAAMNEMFSGKQAELEAAITHFNSVMDTAASEMPRIMANMQKASEDLKAISAQVRSEPTAIIRRRERSDPKFVEPAEK